MAAFGLVLLAAGCRIGYDPLAADGGDSSGPADAAGSGASPGAICSAGAACASGICSDGRCCETRCSDPCTACGPGGACEPALGTLMLSAAVDRANAVRLDGSTLGEQSYIFLEACVELDRVRYHVDAPDAVEANEEGNEPFDFTGTNTDGQPRPLLAGMLASGTRLLYASCEAAGGEVYTLAATVEATGAPGLKLSDRPDRADAVPLADATLSGDAYIFYVDDGFPFDRLAEFYLDDPQATGAPVAQEQSIPLDLGGGMTLADPFDTTSLANGAHTLTVVMEQTGGGASSETVSFEVANP